MKKVAIIGGSGLIGSELSKVLQTDYKVIIITRQIIKSNNSNIEYAYWDGKSSLSAQIDGCYAVINLAGANIGNRWTNNYKKKILESRVNTTRILSESIQKLDIKPHVWIQASACGFYGNLEKTFNETSEKGDGFLSDVCVNWENAAIAPPDTKLIIVRTGLVLSPKAKIWKQLSLSIKFGIATILGNGKQFLPWIHLKDEVDAISFLLHKEASGIFNLAAPVNCTMTELVKNMTKNKFHLFNIHIPTFIIKLLFGKEMAKEIILVNQKVESKKIQDAGFVFTFKRVEDLF